MVVRAQPHVSLQVPLAIVALLSLIGAEIGRVIVVPVGDLSFPVLWPPVGALLAVLLLSDRQRWSRQIAVGCAAMLASLVVLHGRQWTSSVGLTLVFGIEASVATWVVRRQVTEPFALNRVSHATALAVAAVVVPMVGATLGPGALVLTGHPWSFASWRAWWLAGMLGMLVTTPLAVGVLEDWSASSSTRLSWAQIERLLLLAATAAAAIAVFGDQASPFLRVPAYMLPFLLWPVFRFDPGTSAAALFIVSTIGLWNATMGHGPFGMTGASLLSIILRSQGSLAVAAMSFLFLASEVAERKRIASENETLVAELQHAMGEIKTLRGFIPICAWCHKVRDDAGFWQQIERYIDANTDATISHGICPSCSKQATEEIAVQQHLSRM
jgi:integral membrane sensor domain MASE1